MSEGKLVMSMSGKNAEEAAAKLKAAEMKMQKDVIANHSDRLLMSTLKAHAQEKSADPQYLDLLTAEAKKRKLVKE